MVLKTWYYSNFVQCVFCTYFLEKIKLGKYQIQYLEMFVPSSGKEWVFLNLAKLVNLTEYAYFCVFLEGMYFFNKNFKTDYSE